MHRLFACEYLNSHNVSSSSIYQDKKDLVLFTYRKCILELIFLLSKADKDESGLRIHFLTGSIYNIVLLVYFPQPDKQSTLLGLFKCFIFPTSASHSAASMLHQNAAEKEQYS